MHRVELIGQLEAYPEVSAKARMIVELLEPEPISLNVVYEPTWLKNLQD